MSPARRHSPSVRELAARRVDLDLAQAQENLDAARAKIAALDEEIAELRKTRAAYVRARDSLYRYLAEPPNGLVRGGSSDKLVVETSALAPHVERYIAVENGEGKGGVKSLARAAGVPAKTIRNIRQGKTKVTTLAVADDLLAAMGRAYLIDTGDIEVRSNTRHDYPFT